MLDRNSSKPLYAQLEELLRSQIVNSELAPGQMIPSENELSRMCGISRMTVRSVITTLVKEGLLFRVQGKGTFVARPKISASSPAYVGIREQLEKLGYSTETCLLTLEEMVPPKKIAGLLNLPDNAAVRHIRRVRYADGEPVSIHESFIPCSLWERCDPGRIRTDQLCTILKDECGLTPARVLESLESVLATKEEADLLKIEKGYPLLLLRETNFTNTGIPYEHTKIAFRGDKIRLDFEYHLS